MTDTVRSLADVLALNPLNTSRLIGGQDARDHIVSSWSVLSEGASTNALSWDLDASGIADSTSAMETLLDEVASGASVFFPPGTYDFSTWSNYKTATSFTKSLNFWAIPDTVTFTGPGNDSDTVAHRFLNFGGGTTNIRLSGINFNTWGRVLAVLPGSGNDLGNVIIEKCKFENVGQTITSWTATPTATSTTDYFVFKDNEIKDFSTSGVDITVCGTWWRTPVNQAFIHNNIITNLTSASGTAYGVVVGESSTTGWHDYQNLYKQVTITNNAISGITGESGNMSCGVLLTGDYGTISHNQISNTSDEGIYTKARNCVIDGNVILNWNIGSGVGDIDSTAAIKMEGYDRTSASGQWGHSNIISNNILVNTNRDYNHVSSVTGQALNCIEIYSAEVLITNNFIEGAGGGIMCSSQANQIDIVDNHFKFIQGPTLINISGTPVSGDGGNFIIRDNICWDFASTGTAAASEHMNCIRIKESSTQKDHIIIDGNIFHYHPSGASRGSGHRAIQFELASGTPTTLNDVQITNNTFVNADVGIVDGSTSHKFADGLHVVSGLYIQDNKFGNTTTPIHSNVKAGMDLSASTGTKLVDCVWKNNDGYSSYGVAITGGGVIDVSSEDEYYTVTNTGAQTITDFSGRLYSGRQIFLSFADGNTTIQHNASNILLDSSSNFTPGADSTLSLQRIGSVWREIGRMST